MLWPEHLASCPRGNLLANVGDGSKVDVSECPADVRFGSKADIAACPRNVRFVPKADQVRCSKKGSFLAAVSTMVAIRAFPDSI